jgi:hypothetical protein
MKYGKKLLFLPLLTFLAIGVFSYLHLSKTFAQESNYDVTVSPVFFDLSVNPGGTINDRIRVRNNTTSPLTVNIEVRRLTGDEQGELTFNEDNNDGSLNWLNFSENTLTLTPLEFTNIPFSITVPEDAAYGYYYTVNLTQKGVSQETTGTAISGAVAVPILLNVRKDGAQAKLDINTFDVESYINETLPVNFDVKLANTGNVHVRPRGNIFISGMGKDNITVIDINPGSGAIIPNTTRLFKSEWNDGFIVKEAVMEDGAPKLDKNGKTVMKTKINWNKLTDMRFGKYTANLLVVYDDGTRDVPIEASKSFWVVPYKTILVIVVFVIGLILLTRFVLKRYINREIRKQSKK